MAELHKLGLLSFGIVDVWLWEYLAAEQGNSVESLQIGSFQSNFCLSTDSIVRHSASINGSKVKYSAPVC